MTTFLVVWAGRLLTVLGSKASAFALSLWVYQQTHSISQFSTGLFLGFVPGLFLSPAAGVLVDRHRRRTILLCADAVALTASGALMLSQSTGHLAVWQIYALVAVQSGCAAFQWPALSAAVTTMVSPRQRGRAGAMTQTALACAQLLGPTLATVLLGFGGLTGVLLADTATFVLGLVSLVVVKFPEPGTATEKGANSGTESMLARAGWYRELRTGWRLIGSDWRLARLLRLATVVFAVQAATPVLLLPLIVVGLPESRQSMAVAVVSTAGGIGLASASLVMSVWRGPDHRLVWTRASAAVSGLAIIVAGACSKPIVLTGAAFIFSFGIPVVVSCSQTIWQDVVDPAVQGRVFALRRMVVQAGTMGGLLAAGPLAVYGCAPLLRSGGLLHDNLEPIFGAGTEGGSRLLLFCTGLGLVGTALVDGSRRKAMSVRNGRTISASLPPQ